MEPKEIAAAYDQIASWWRERHRNSSYGLSFLERAMKFLPMEARSALDVGCGSEGRFLRTLHSKGFEVSGLDISAEMIALIREEVTVGTFYCADICIWDPPRKYGLITAWDSIFHLPLAQHEAVLTKLCRTLIPEGVLLFTAGGGGSASEISGAFEGQNFTYSTLGVPKFIEILLRRGCEILHVEYDQHPENHVVIIARSTV